MSASTNQKGFQYSCKAVVYFSVSFLVNSKKNKKTTKNKGTITFFMLFGPVLWFKDNNFSAILL